MATVVLGHDLLAQISTLLLPRAVPKTPSLTSVQGPQQAWYLQHPRIPVSPLPLFLSVGAEGA